MASSPGGSSCGVDRLVVAREEGLPRAVLPALGRRPAAQDPRARRRVAEGAQHARDVAQRRALQAPLGDRAPRLALEVEQHPAALGEHGLAEVVVAVGADDAPARADVGERLQALLDVLAAAADRIERLELGQLDEDPLDLLVDRRGEDRQRLRARLLGREGRVGRLRAERRVQLAGHDAERVQVREERLGVGGQRVEREVPAVGRAGQVLLQHAQRGVHEPALVLVPARDRRDVREAALGQEAQQLELRVDARLDAPERLQDQRLAEHDRGVGLLDADRAHLDGPAFGRAARPAEAERPVARLHVDARAHQVQQLARVGGVGQRVVEGLPADLGDHPLGPLLVVRPDADRHLVDLVRPGREAHLDHARARAAGSRRAA